MTHSRLPPLPAAETPLLKRRVNDVEPTHPPKVTAIEDPELLYGELRAGRRSIDSLAPFVPLNVVFMWHAQRRISEAEFAVLMADLEIHQVEISDLPRHKSGQPDAEQQRCEAVIAAFKSRMSHFERVAEQNTVTEEELKSIFLAGVPLVDGIGIRMSFSRIDDPAAGAKEAGAPALTVLCRAFIASRSMQSTVKCEAVFSAATMEQELYCRIVLPLPLHKGGRRRLLVSVLDNETRQPVKLPPELAELFHEKNMTGLQLLRKNGQSTGGIGSTVLGAFGKMFKR